MRVIIRADGNQEIAMGHIMRCLSIGDALRRAGAEVIFVTAGAETERLLREKGFEHHVLGTSYREMEAELSLFRSYMSRKPADWILTDSYFVTKRYMQEVGTWCRTAYLDDMGHPVYPLSMLINYNIYAKQLPYEAWYEEAGLKKPERCLLGTMYAPLRAEFCRGSRSRAGAEVRDVLITTGGGDRCQAAASLCRRLEREIACGKHKNVRFHVVCGPFSESKEELYKLAECSAAFVIHENVTHMSELMAGCDIAVSAAGSTMYELCSMNLPAICFYFAENQRQMAECFGNTTDILNAGSLFEDADAALDRICEGILKLEQDARLRSRVRRQMQELTDGKGAERIAGALLQRKEADAEGSE